MCIPNLKNIDQLRKIMRPLPTVLRRLCLKFFVVDETSQKFLSSRFGVLPKCMHILERIEQIFPILKSHLGCEVS